MYFIYVRLQEAVHGGGGQRRNIDEILKSTNRNLFYYYALSADFYIV